jgi:hypothetical protein
MNQPNAFRFSYHLMGMLGLLMFSVFFTSCSNPKKRTVKEKKINYSNWVTLTDGMEYREVSAPIKSQIGDSKISILRFDRDFFEFDVFSATNVDSMPRSVHEWVDNFQLKVAFNAGMYSQENTLMSRAFLKTGEHVNNPEILQDFNLMMAMRPNVPHRENIEVLDLTCENFSKMNHEFNSYAQGLRMIDCNGKPMFWKKEIQSCSMIIAAEGADKKFYVIFCRSPYTHNQMIQFMLDMPYGIRNAIYLEGGPETSLLIHVNQHHIEKVGSWVSDTWESDANTHFWRLPNVVGVKSRLQKK